MSNYCKTAFLEAYRCGTLPYRLAANRYFTRCNSIPVIVLYYHRVADTSPVDWSLTNAQFRRHIDWLQDRYDLVTLAEARRRIAEGNSRPSVHITFDDGYAENCDAAIPLLLDRRIPCTYFVTVDNIVHAKPFRHDRARGQIFPVNSVAQIREMAENGIEIAAHTRTHADLGNIQDPQVLYDEIVLARRELSNLLNRPIRYFAFPFGMKTNLNPVAAAMAKADGIECVVSGYGGYNRVGGDTFHLQRCHADPELIRLRNAITFDPRHMWKNQVFFESADSEVAAAIDYYRSRNHPERLRDNLDSNSTKHLVGS